METLLGGATDAVKEGEQDDSADNEKARTLSEHREGDGDGEDQRGAGGDPRAEKNADAEQDEDDASDESGCAENLIDDGLRFAADGYVGPDPGFDKTHRRTVEERWRS